MPLEDDSTALAEQISALLRGHRISVGMEALLNVMYATAALDPICARQVADQLDELAARVRTELTAPAEHRHPSG